MTSSVLPFSLQQGEARLPPFSVVGIFHSLSRQGTTLDLGTGCSAETEANLEG